MFCHGDHGLGSPHKGELMFYKLTKTKHMLFKQGACQRGSPLCHHNIDIVARNNLSSAMSLEFGLTTIKTLSHQNLH